MKKDEFIAFVQSLKSEDQRFKEAIVADAVALAQKVGIWLSAAESVSGARLEKGSKSAPIDFHKNQLFDSFQLVVHGSGVHPQLVFAVENAYRAGVARLIRHDQPGQEMFLVRTGDQEWRITNDPNASHTFLTTQPLLTEETFYDCCRDLLSR